MGILRDFHSHKKHPEKLVLYILIFMILDKRWEDDLF
jgi:hypothetical protein